MLYYEEAAKRAIKLISSSSVGVNQFRTAQINCVMTLTRTTDQKCKLQFYLDYTFLVILNTRTFPWQLVTSFFYLVTKFAF